MIWKGESRSQQGAEECFAPGAELQLLGGGHDSMRSDEKWRQKLAEATEGNSWGVMSRCLLRWWCRWSRHA